MVLKPGTSEMMRRLKQREFSTDQFGSNGKAKNSTVQVKAGGEVAGELWVCK